MIENWIKVSDELPKINKSVSKQLICKMAKDSPIPEYKIMVLRKRALSDLSPMDKILVEQGETKYAYKFTSLEQFDTYSLDDVESWKYINPEEDDNLNFCSDTDLISIDLRKYEDLELLKTSAMLNLNITKEFIDYLLTLRKENRTQYVSIIDTYFRYRGNLEKVEFEDGIEIIPVKMFESTSIKNLVLPKSIKWIQESAFNFCRCLESVDFPDNIEIIDISAFEGSSINKVKLPKNLKVLGSAAFENCDNLTDVDLSEYSLEYIPEGCFENCTKLEVFSIPKGVKIIEDDAFWGCVNLELVDIPDSVKIIGNSVFSDCNKLKNLILPNNLEIIGIQAFNNCNALTKIILPESLEVLGDYCFRSCRSLELLKFPSNAKNILLKYPTLVNGCGKLKEIICSKESYDYLSEYLKNNSLLRVE